MVEKFIHDNWTSECDNRLLHGHVCDSFPFVRRNATAVWQRHSDRFRLMCCNFASVAREKHKEIQSNIVVNLLPSNFLSDFQIL